MPQAEGALCEKTERRAVCSPVGLEPAQSFLDCKKWSPGKENYFQAPFLLHSEGNVHRRDVGGIAQERFNHKATNAR